jgi:hypothetical protein
VARAHSVAVRGIVTHFIFEGHVGHFTVVAEQSMGVVAGAARAAASKT